MVFYFDFCHSLEPLSSYFTDFPFLDLFSSYISCRNEAIILQSSESAVYSAFEDLECNAFLIAVHDIPGLLPCFRTISAQLFFRNLFSLS